MPKWPLTRAGKEVGSPDGEGTAVAPAVQSADPAPVPLADDLIRRIVKAIDEWAADNDLTNLPRKIVFEQALSIMTSLYETTNGGKKR
jgi:hypothetical protein